MTDEQNADSRFAEDPGWVTPEAHYRHLVDLWPEARDRRERALLQSAIRRPFFSDCTDEEQECIRAMDLRVGGTRVPL